MPILSGNFSKALKEGVRGWFGQFYGERKPEWTMIFDQETSEDQFEEYVSTTGFGLAQQMPEGSGVTYATHKQGYIQRFDHVIWSLGFIISRVAVEDNKYMKLAKRRTKSLAFSMHQTKEIVHADILNNAFDSNYPYADGVSIINAAHPNISGGTRSNLITTASDLNELAIEQLCIQIDLSTDDVGLKIPVDPVKLIYHPNNTFNAHRIMKSDKQSGTALNDINALRDIGVIRDGNMKYRYLDDTDAWFIKTDGPGIQGLLSLQRRPMENDQDNEFDTHNFKYQANERYSAGIVDWLGLWGSPGA